VTGGSVERGASRLPPTFHPCASCAPGLDAHHGEAVLLDGLSLTALTRYVGPYRGRLSAADRRRAAALYDRLANVTPAAGCPPVGEPFVVAVAAELCGECSARLAEHYCWSRPTVVLANAACRSIAPYLNVHRGPLSAKGKEQAGRLQLGLIAATDRVFAPFRFDAHKQAGDEAGER
jgi:hypothetical protein